MLIGVTTIPLIISPFSTVPIFTQGDASNEYFIDVKSIKVGGRVLRFKSFLLSINNKDNGDDSIVEVNKNVACLGFVDGGKEPRTTFVIGGHQLEDNILEFDLVSSKLGFSSSLLLHNVRRFSNSKANGNLISLE
ncbi:putative aspartic proteinase GIP2 [Trifolium repens]|nr:putative aspartic proteinase GIP2 [Trifolium repens]